MNIPIILFVISLILFLGFSFRNKRVFDFRMRILNLETNKYLAEKSKYLAEKSCKKNPFELHDRYTYDEMFFSFKPLKLEYWFTKEEVKSLLKYETKS